MLSMSVGDATRPSHAMYSGKLKRRAMRGVLNSFLLRRLGRLQRRLLCWRITFRWNFTGRILCRWILRRRRLDGRRRCLGGWTGRGHLRCWLPRKLEAMFNGHGGVPAQWRCRHPDRQLVNARRWQRAGLVRSSFTKVGDGDPGPIRTGDLPLRRGTLYPAELRGHVRARQVCPAAGCTHIACMQR